MTVDIVIPTMKSETEISDLVSQIKQTRKTEGQLIVTGLKVSASTNRNFGLYQTQTETVIMIDDDIDGFYTGWDLDIIKPLDFDNCQLTSARLMRPGGGYACMMDLAIDDNIPFVEAHQHQLPTSAIAFQKTGVFFDEAFVGSGFEDNDFCLQIYAQDRNRVFLINNKCRLIHRNEAKNQTGPNWQKNKSYFLTKWNARGGE